jgi:hypothetical protein
MQNAKQRQPSSSASSKPKNRSEYTNAFICLCIHLSNSIQQNKSFSKCLHILIRCAMQNYKDTTTTVSALGAQTPSPPSPPSSVMVLTADNYFEPLWFVYYMFFAIHNPKLEEYINRKHSSNQKPQQPAAIAAAHILKNMIRRRKSTSNLVYTLFDYAFLKNQKVTRIYKTLQSEKESTTSTTNPEKLAQTSQNQRNQLMKSHQAGHLKTTAAIIKQLYEKSPSSNDESDLITAYRSFIEYLTATTPTTATTTTTATTATTTAITLYTSNVDNICEKMHKNKYHRKDIIFLALAIYMKIQEDDIVTQSVFISLTEEETILMNAEMKTMEDEDYAEEEEGSSIKLVAPAPAEATNNQYDEKYKYLLS